MDEGRSISSSYSKITNTAKDFYGVLEECPLLMALRPLFDLVISLYR